MNTFLNVKLKTNYHVELIRESTGEVTHSGDFHNSALVGFKHLIASHPYFNIFRALAVGGSDLPTEFTMTSLKSPLWQVRASSVTHEWLDDYTIRGTASFSFPATSAYVGEVKELGLICKQYQDGGDGPLCTRALLTDSEGQPMSFNKTDLDVLVINVTVEISLNSNNDSFKIFKRNLLLCRIMGLTEGAGDGRYSWFSVFGYINLCRFLNTLEGDMSSGIVIDTKIESPDVTVDITENVCYCTYAVGRLPATTITSEHYYAAVAIPTIGYWELPNEEIFPAYTISNIPIGTGDGTTKQFENPLNYFKQGTEKVYKNGTLLTRDTDYTINNIGNKDCLPELVPLSRITKVTCSLDRKEYTKEVYSLVFPVAQGPDISYGINEINKYAEDRAPIFDAANPLYIEYEKEVTLNCFKCTGGLRGLFAAIGENTLPQGVVFYLDYSVDGETYLEATSATTVAVNGVFNVDFADITAKYWRIRTSYTSYAIGMPRKINAENFMILSRKDPYIVFTEAPADGDILTMEVKMDLIMKNANFVVDASGTVSFSI